MVAMMMMMMMIVCVHHQLHLLLIPFSFNFTQLTIDYSGFSAGFTFRSWVGGSQSEQKASESDWKCVGNDTNMKANHICIHMRFMCCICVWMRVFIFLTPLLLLPCWSTSHRQMFGFYWNCFLRHLNVALTITFGTALADSHVLVIA